MKKGVFVKDIVPNAEAAGIFAVADAALAQSRNGPYWRLVLADAALAGQHPQSIDCDSAMSSGFL